MTDLNFEQILPASKEVNSLVILLHGYGANGKDLMDLGSHLQPNLPNTLFIAPDGPQKCPAQPSGFQWFNLPAYDGSSPIEMGRTLQESVLNLTQLVNEKTEEHDLERDRVFLLGFSQGTMLALKYAIEAAESVGGVIGFSGRLMTPIRDDSEITSKPPVLLLHDKDDEVVPFSEMALAEENLKKFDFKVYTCSSKGAGHSISPVSLGVALHFIARELISD